MLVCTSSAAISSSGFCRELLGSITRRSFALRSLSSRTPPWSIWSRMNCFMRRCSWLTSFLPRPGFDLGARMPGDVRRCGGHFLQVVRRNAGGEAHRNSKAAIEETKRQACGQQHRLVEFAVVVLDEIDGALGDFGEQQFRESRQP